MRPVIPAKAGIHALYYWVDPGLRLACAGMTVVDIVASNAISAQELLALFDFEVSPLELDLRGTAIYWFMLVLSGSCLGGAPARRRR